MPRYGYVSLPGISSLVFVCHKLSIGQLKKSNKSWVSSSHDRTTHTSTVWPCSLKLSTMSALTRAGRLVGRSASTQMHHLRRGLHQSTSACGLLRNQIPSNTRRRRGWPFGTNALHNVPAMRPISFARVLPNLAIKLFRIPALLGGTMITGFAYIQYQTIREFCWPAKSRH